MLWLGKLQYQQLTAWLEHTLHGAQRRVFVGHITQAKGDGDDIEVIVREGQCFGVGLYITDVAHYALVAQLAATDFEHGIIDIRQDNLTLVTHQVRELGGQITGTTGQIQHLHSRTHRRTQW